jgi:ATP-dependent RNA helicase DDX54/DBP10
MARTGSGKTAAFVLTILQRLLMEREHEQQTSSSGSNSNNNSSSSSSVEALILSPTRELALQTLKLTNMLASFIENPPIKTAGIVGGQSIEGNFDILAKKPHILVATPGRLSHLTFATRNS